MERDETKLICYERVRHKIEKNMRDHNFFLSWDTFSFVEAMEDSIF